MARRNKKNEEGVVTIITVLTLGMLVLAIAFTVALNSAGQISKNRNLSLGDKLFYTADAQAREGLYQYIKDPDIYTAGSYFELNGATNGSVTAAITEWPYLEITSVAENNTVQRRVIYTVTTYVEGLAFDHAIYSQNDIELGGNANVNGDIFANTDIDVNGSASVHGDAYSPGNINDIENDIEGEAHSGVQPIPAPSVDTTPYYDEALAGGTSFSANGNAEAYLNNRQREAVVFIEDTGLTEIQGSNTKLKGAIVSMGDLRMSGGTITASQDHMAVIVLGDLRITGGTTINGIVYVTGETSFGSGNNVINGSLISAGGGGITVEISGNGNVNFDSEYVFSLNQLAGISGSTSSEEPRILNWREE